MVAVQDESSFGADSMQQRHTYMYVAPSQHQHIPPLHKARTRSSALVRQGLKWIIDKLTREV